MMTISVKEQRLADLLKDIFDANKVPLVIESGADVVVRNVKFKLAPEALNTLLSSMFGYSVYYDGSTAYVTSSTRNLTRVFKIDKTGQQQARRVLDSLNLSDKRFPVRYDEAARIVSVTGPVRYVNAVEAALSVLEDSTGVKPKGDVRIFALKAGIAQDRTLVVDGKEVVLPGVVSILRRIFGKGSTVQVADSAGSRRPGRGVSPLDPATGVPRNNGLQSRDDIAGGFQVREVAVRGPEPEDMPVFESVPYINAIAVRDVPERLRIYEEIIRQLDVKPAVVSIEVSVVEISNDAIEKLGVEWKFGNSRGGISTSGIGALPAQIPIDGRGKPVTETGGVGFLSSVGLRSLFQAKVNALVQDGSAKVVSTPRIVTLMSEEGQFSDSSTFYAKVAGNLEANLFSIESGTSIRVTPFYVLGEDGAKRMRLIVRIEDGSLSAQTVDQLPVTRKSLILTSAIVPLNESLALAGLSQEITSTIQGGVPVLKSLPVLGGLFRTKEDQRKSVQRVFLITPRIIE